MIPMNYNHQNGTIALRVQYCHAYLGNKPQLLDSRPDQHEGNPRTRNLSNYTGLVKPWILEKNL